MIFLSTTINDVAKAAGVSASTVSRVLSDSPRISDVTKNRVREAIKELNYYPNAVARSLANSSTKTIGLIMNTETDLLIQNPFFIQAMAGISSFAQENGYNVMFAYNKNEDEDLNIAIRYVSGRLVDGIILFTSRSNDKCISYLKSSDFPFSVIGRPDDAKDSLWVDNDNFQATYQVADYLISIGHNKIAFIGGPLALNVSKDRLEGFKKAMSIHGYATENDYLFENGDFTEAFGYECANKIISNCQSGQTKPTAIVTCDDMQALGVLKALSENKIDDIAVTGFNNTIAGMFQSRMLASVDVNADKLGFYAAKLLFDSIEAKENTASHYIVPAQLVKKGQ